MRLPVTVRREEPKPGQRILVTSDIHGHRKHLKALLEMADFGENDLLVVVGDLLEKGSDSLGTLRELMALEAAGRAMVVMGNVDFWRITYWDELEEAVRAAEETTDAIESLRAKRLAMEYAHRLWEEILSLGKTYGSSFFGELLEELGLHPKGFAELMHAVPAVARAFAPELAFLRTRPTVLETPRYRFVHGGLRQPALSENLPLDAYSLMKYDWFARSAREKGWVMEKYTVVGHWPVALNCSAYADSAPRIDTDTGIVSIDGGCGVMLDGQLNLLILPDAYAPVESATHLFYDEFPTMTVTRDQEESDSSLYVHWHDDTVRLIRTEEDMAFVEHIRTGHRLWVPADYLYGIPEESRIPGAEGGCRDISDYRLPLRAGDTVRVVKTTSHGIIAKKGSVTGWVMA